MAVEPSKGDSSTFNAGSAALGIRCLSCVCLWQCVSALEIPAKAPGEGGVGKANWAMHPTRSNR